MAYCVGIDENKFYRGCFARIGKVGGKSEMMEALPPQENQLCYYIDFKEEIVIEQVPVKVYTKTVVSETEFDTYYELKSLQDDIEIFTNITEEEYNALTDEEKENVTITSIPKVTHVELTKEEYEALTDEEKHSIYVSTKLDEEGNIVKEDVEKTIIVKEWAFSQEKYDELEAQRIVDEEAKAEQEAYEESISNETLKEENAMLTEQVKMLTECILEMSEMLYA